MSCSFYRLGEVCRISTGQSAPQDIEAFGSTGQPFVRAGSLKRLVNGDPERTLELITQEIADQYRLRLFPAGTIVFAKSGMSAKLGRVHILNTPCYVVSHLATVEPSPSVYGRWLLHWFRANSPTSLITNDAYPSIRTSEIEGIEVALPDFQEQQRIALILDNVDSLRLKRQKAIRLVDELLRATFIDMFGDPSTNPKNFEIGTIRDLVATANYGTSEKASEEAGEYQVLRMNNITYEGGWNFSSLKYVDLDPANAHKYIAQKGDLLFNRTNSKELVGKTAVYMRDEPMAIAGYLVRVRMNKRGNPHYVSGYLNSTHGKQTLVARAKSIVGMANINAQEMQDIPLLLPPIELQDKYARIFEAAHQHLQMHQMFLHEAVALGATLSYKFFGPINSEKE
jgi:type I restriction enzyme S subunit